MGHYAIFANLLDMSGIAVPSGMTHSDLPFGVTMLAQAGGETWLLPLAAACHKATGLPPGACRAPDGR
jgi:allophanate hydrolase